MPTALERHLATSPGASEIVEKRALTSKTIQNVDGSRTLQAHVGHIHYFDGAQFLDVNTTLVPVAEGWTVSKANYAAEIPLYADGWMTFYNTFKLNPFTLVALAGADSELASRALDATHVQGVVVETGPWAGKQVLYSGAFGAGIDLLITARAHGLWREVIIRQRPSGDLQFAFELSTQATFLQRNEAVIDRTQLADLEAQHRVLESAKRFAEARLVTAAIRALLGQLEQNSTRTAWDRKSPLLTSGSLILSGDKNTWLRDFKLATAGGVSYPCQVALTRAGAGITLTKMLTGAFFSELPDSAFPLVIDDTASYFSGAGDGYCTNTDASWVTCHTAASSDSADYTSTTFKVGTTSGYTIWRVHIPFDTSDLTDNCKITLGSVNLYVETLVSLHSIYDHTRMDLGEQASPSAVVVGDYDAFDSDIVMTSGPMFYQMSPPAYDDWTLTGEGFVAVSRTGWTKFCVREEGDYMNGAPTNEDSLVCSSSEHTLTSQDPYLAITYLPDPSRIYMRHYRNLRET